MRKILFLITALENGGAENQVVQLCSRLVAKKYVVELVSMIEPLQYKHELNNAGIKIHSLGMSKGVADPRAIFRLRAIIRAFQPDIVHSHMVHANLLARAARLVVRIPFLICTAHSINEGGRIREFLYQVTDPLCDLTTNVSEEGVKRYVQVKAAQPNKIIYMPNGIDLHKFTDQRDNEGTEEIRVNLRSELNITNEFVWLTIGRLVPEKDYPNMLAAFAKVLQIHPKSVLLIVGEGPIRSTAEQLCHSLNIAHAVHFLGIRKDVPNLLLMSDAFVLSSLWEGLSMVLLEASASALPIIATDVGGNHEIVRDEVSGYLVDSSDSEQLAAKMLDMMMLDSIDRREMGRNGRAHVIEQYDMDQVIERWEHYYLRR